MNFSKNIRLYNLLAAKNSSLNEINIVYLTNNTGIKEPYARQIIQGSKPPTRKMLSSIVKETNIDERVWELDPFQFGSHLGLSDYEIASLLKIEVVGMNFRSQLREPNQVNDIFELTEGYYFSYYYSVSNFEKRVVCRDVFHVSKLDEFGQIRVVLKDGYFEYSGVCVPIRNHLYFMLEKDHGFDEIVVYCTNLPNNHNRDLFGIILCNSVKLEKRQQSNFPAASKVYFRFLGKKLIDVSENIEREINSFDELKVYATYIDLEDPESFGPTDISEIDNIDNTITIDKIPFALIADE